VGHKSGCRFYGHWIGNKLSEQKLGRNFACAPACPDFNTNAYPDGRRYGHRYSYVFADSHSYIHTDSYSYVYAYSDVYAYAYADIYPDTNTTNALCCGQLHASLPIRLPFASLPMPN
jgi:hypothetical protein